MPWFQDEYGESHQSPEYEGDLGDDPGSGDEPNEHPNKPKSSIWGDDQDDNPAEGYKYRKHRGTEMPQNKGNSLWGGPQTSNSWGEDPNDVDTYTRDGMPKGSGGYSRGGHGLLGGTKVDEKIDEVAEKYKKVRHPSRALKKKIMADLAARIPRAEAKKVMRNRKWL